MTHDLSCTTARKEGESSASIKNGIEKNPDSKSRTAFQTSYTKQLITAVHTVGAF